MRNRILFLLCFLCIGLQAFAQISISGKVVDAGGLELPGVNVMVKGTTIGTFKALKLLLDCIIGSCKQER